MNRPVLLCLDEVSLENPVLVGLEDEALEAQDWLAVFTNGGAARGAVEGAREAWVVSAEDVDAVNLAATLKADSPDTIVRMVDPGGGGSLRSRARTAGIDEVMPLSGLVGRYNEAKRAFGGAGGSPVLEVPCALAVPKPAAMAGSLAPSLAAPSPAPLAAPRPEPAAKGEHMAFLMPVVSGSGGAGKSTVAVLAALLAQRMGNRVLLVDYDLQFGDTAWMLGLSDVLAADEALANPDLLQKACAVPGLVHLGPPSRLEAAEQVAHDVPGLLDSVAAQFDVIVANTGAFWAEQHAALLERSSAVLFLVDQRASSVRACKHALELCARCGIATGPFRFAVNRCAKNAPLTSIDVSCALQGRPVYELKDGGAEVEDYLGGGAARELLDQRNDLVASLADVLGRLLPATASAALPAPAQSVGADPSGKGMPAGSLLQRGKRLSLAAPHGERGARGTGGARGSRGTRGRRSSR